MANDLDQYVADNMSIYIDTLLEHAHPVVLETFRMARRLGASSKQHAIVLEALHVWVGSRIIEKGWAIVGEDKLDVEPVTDPASPFIGSCPIPPTLDGQIDATVIKNLIKRRDQLLRDLKAKIMKRKRGDWLDSFLALFIMLHSIEQFTQHFQRYERRTNPSPGLLDFQTMHRYFHCAKTLLTHFHAINKGFMPFLLDWTAGEAKELAEVDEDSADFVAGLIQKMTLEENRIKSLHQEQRYEDELYWCSQLFSQSWQPGKAD